MSTDSRRSPTRDEVLAAESKVAVAGCDIREGEWVSYYDGRTWFRSSDVDIDHLVPLAEAWDSGASKWTARTRAAFANDLRFRPSLVAVTDNVNQSKSDQDFREWQPTRARCRYLREWVSVKTRWKLTADAAEKPFMRNFAETCRNRLLRVPIATVRFAEEPTEPPPPTATSVEIAGILYNPDGDESQNPNTEYLEIQNGTDESVELSSWSLSDDTVATYVFGDFTLAAGATVRVRSGAGTDTATDVYANWGSRWNNDGDTATLYDASGVVVDTCSYQSTTSGYADC